MKPAILRWTIALAAVALVGLTVATSLAANCGPKAPPVFINTWLVLGTFPNTANNSGLDHPWINEIKAAPEDGALASGHTWRYFDDRLFSRNYDNYQDLFSYFHIERRESVAGVVAYAHVYLYVPRAQSAQLRMAADWSAQAWLNGKMITHFIDGSGNRQTNTTDIQLQKGWNSLLLKIANTEEGRFGFYARVCDRQGGNLPDLTISPNGPGNGTLQVTTQAMADLNLQPLGLAKPPAMPMGWRGWPYVGAHPDLDNPVFNPLKGGPLSHFLPDPNDMMEASNFQFTAQGGTPPYTWLLGNGHLPPGLLLRSNGSLIGTISAEAKIDDYHFRVWVMDSRRKLASKELSIIVRPRPNKWYEEARFVGLMEGTESLSPNEILPYVKILKREGYQAIIVNAFNNGGLRFHYPSRFSKIPVRRDWVALWKAAIEKEGMKFGIYMGNITGIPQPPFSNNQAVLVLQEVVRRFHPAALWFDWSGLDAISPDAMFSAIRTLDSDLVIVLNGSIRGSNGDWDEICFEGFGAWGTGAWDIWPTSIPWPKTNAPEGWRLMVQPGWSFNPTNILSSWRQMLRIRLSLIGAGYVADIDALPWLGAIQHPLPFSQMPLVANHQKMTDWANPPGFPSLVPSFTWVNPGPLHQAFWGYDTINLKRNTIFLHMLKNPFGKTGLPDDPTLRVAPLTEKVKNVIWMNTNRTLKFIQPHTRTDHGLIIDIQGITQDPIDTIIRIDLDHPVPKIPSPVTLVHRNVPMGNLACFKPAWLLSMDGSHELAPCDNKDYARNGVDGNPLTVAEAGGEWAWTYQVDLRRLCRVGRIVVNFAPNGYATEYNLLFSIDGQQWTRAAHITTGHGGINAIQVDSTLTRYVRIQAVKPDGPGQPGVQMAIAELQIFAADKKR